MPEVEDGKAAGACGCGEVVSQVGEEDGEDGFAEEVNNYGLLGYGCMRNSCTTLDICNQCYRA